MLRPLIEGVEEAEEADEQEQAEAAERALTAARQAMRPLTDREHTLLKELDAWAARPDNGRTPSSRASGNGSTRSSARRTEGRMEGQAGHRLHRVPRHPALAARAAAQRPGTRRTASRSCYGGQDRDEREHVKQVFQESPDLSPVRILLATDAASEGINLQAPLPPAAALGDPLEPEPPGAAQRPRGPARPEGRPGGRVPLRARGLAGLRPAHESRRTPATRTAPWRTSCTSSPWPPARPSGSVRTWAAPAR